jgi:hypothetical protein
LVQRKRWRQFAARISEATLQSPKYSIELAGEDNAARLKRLLSSVMNWYSAGRRLALTH